MVDGALGSGQRLIPSSGDQSIYQATVGDGDIEKGTVLASGVAVADARQPDENCESGSSRWSGHKL